MRSATPGTRVGDVAASFALTPRTLQRIFARHVGASPKQVLQRLRRQRAVDQISEGSAPRLRSPGWPPNSAISTRLTSPMTSERRFAEAPQLWPLPAEPLPALPRKTTRRKRGGLFSGGQTRTADRMIVSALSQSRRSEAGKFPTRCQEQKPLVRGCGSVGDAREAGVDQPDPQERQTRSQGEDVATLAALPVTWPVGISSILGSRIAVGRPGCRGIWGRL
jgi:AraC-like DNA-binding protein